MEMRQQRHDFDEVGPHGGQQPQLDRSSSSWKVPQSEWYESRMGPGAIGSANLANFIRKVYGILAVQMVITVAISMVAMFVPIANGAFIELMMSPMLRVLLFVPTMCIMCALQAKKSDYPLNYQLLIVFTVLMSMDIAGVCALYQKVGYGYLILQAFMITMGAFGGLSLYALKSGRDFTWMGGILSMSLVALILAGFVGSIFGFNGGIIMPIFGTVIFCGYILYDTSRILRVYGPDDAIIAAVELYLDILNLFLYILELLSRRSD